MDVLRLKRGAWGASAPQVIYFYGNSNELVRGWTADLLSPGFGTENGKYTKYSRVFRTLPENKISCYQLLSISSELPLGEAPTIRVRSMPSSAKNERKCFFPTLHRYFSADPSGGKVLVSARTLRRSRLKGRCRKAAPLRIPRPHRRNCIRNFQLTTSESVEKSPKDTVSLER